MIPDADLREDEARAEARSLMVVVVVVVMSLVVVAALVAAWLWYFAHIVPVAPGF